MGNGEWGIGLANGKTIAPDTQLTSEMQLMKLAECLSSSAFLQSKIGNLKSKMVRAASTFPPHPTSQTLLKNLPSTQLLPGKQDPLSRSGWGSRMHQDAVAPRRLLGQVIQPQDAAEGTG